MNRHEPKDPGVWKQSVRGVDHGNKLQKSHTAPYWSCDSETELATELALKKINK